MTLSYCVNCGVELHESEKKCPLCDTVVINPNIISQEPAESVFPQEQKLVDIIAERRLWAGIVSIVLAIPASICLLCNFGIEKKLSWSLIVTSALVMVWAFIVPVLLMRKTNYIVLFVTYTVGILFFLAVMCWQVSGDWFLSIAVPIVLCFMCVVSINTVVMNHNIAKLYAAAVLFITIGALVVAVEIVTDYYLNREIALSWSLIALVPCALLALLYVIVQRKNGLKNSLKKRFRM